MDVVRLGTGIQSPLSGIRHGLFLINALEPEQKLIRIHRFIQAGIDMIANGILELGVKAVPGCTQRGRAATKRSLGLALIKLIYL